jgi:hypothetical protein
MHKKRGRDRGDAGDEQIRAQPHICHAIAFKINGRFMNWWQVDIPDAELSNVEIWNWR